MSDSDDENEPQCRICKCTEPRTGLISPCKCKGSLQFVHQHCQKTWLDTKKRFSNTDRIPYCDICGYTFQIVYKTPHNNPLKFFFSPKSAPIEVKALWLILLYSLIVIFYHFIGLSETDTILNRYWQMKVTAYALLCIAGSVVTIQVWNMLANQMQDRTLLTLPHLVFSLYFCFLTLGYISLLACYFTNSPTETVSPPLLNNSFLSPNETVEDSNMITNFEISFIGFCPTTPWWDSIWRKINITEGQNSSTNNTNDYWNIRWSKIDFESISLGSQLYGILSYLALVLAYIKRQISNFISWWSTIGHSRLVASFLESENRNRVRHFLKNLWTESPSSIREFFVLMFIVGLISVYWTTKVNNFYTEFQQQDEQLTLLVGPRLNFTEYATLLVSDDSGYTKTEIMCRTADQTLLWKLIALLILLISCAALIVLKIAGYQIITLPWWCKRVLGSGFIYFVWLMVSEFAMLRLEYISPGGFSTLIKELFKKEELGGLMGLSRFSKYLMMFHFLGFLFLVTFAVVGTVLYTICHLGLKWKRDIEAQLHNTENNPLPIVVAPINNNLNPIINVNYRARLPLSAILRFFFQPLRSDIKTMWLSLYYIFLTILFFRAGYFPVQMTIYLSLWVSVIIDIFEHNIQLQSIGYVLLYIEDFLLPQEEDFNENNNQNNNVNNNNVQNNQHNEQPNPIRFTDTQRVVVTTAFYLVALLLGYAIFIIDWLLFSSKLKAAFLMAFQKTYNLQTESHQLELYFRKMNNWIFHMVGFTVMQMIVLIVSVLRPLYKSYCVWVRTGEDEMILNADQHQEQPHQPLEQAQIQ